MVYLAAIDKEGAIGSAYYGGDTDYLSMCMAALLSDAIRSSVAEVLREMGADEE